MAAGGKKSREVIAALAVFSSGKHGLCILRASATSVREHQRGVVEAGFKRMLRERERVGLSSRCELLLKTHTHIHQQLHTYGLPVYDSLCARTGRTGRPAPKHSALLETHTYAGSHIKRDVYNAQHYTHSPASVIAPLVNTSSAPRR